jgi:hypothetical protein
MPSADCGGGGSVASGSLPPRRIILDYAHFNNLCMIAPIARAFSENV